MNSVRNPFMYSHWASKEQVVKEIPTQAKDADDRLRSQVSDLGLHAPAQDFSCMSVHATYAILGLCACYRSQVMRVQHGSSWD
jgi:hypothetical protein